MKEQEMSEVDIFGRETEKWREKVERVKESED